MADVDDRRGSGNTAIVAIVALLLVAVVIFLLFFRPRPDEGTVVDEPDIEVEVNPPAGDEGQ